MRWLVLLLLWVSPAWADSSIAGDAPPFDAARCGMNDGPLRRDWDSRDIKKLTPKGLWLHQAAGRKHLLFSSSHFDQPHRSLVIERATGKTVMTLDGVPNAALVEDSGGKLLGLLALREVGPAPLHLMLHTPSGKEAWLAQPLIDRGSDSATTLVAGELLIVTFFHRIATGSGLAAFDLKTGALKWKAAVEQMNVSHSKYWNDVSLELRGQTIVMRGFEAAGCYQQTFDLTTGKRLSTTMARP